MKSEIERRKPEGFVDYLSLAITTVGVGYIPLAPGTWGSAVGVLIYLAASQMVNFFHFTVRINSSVRSEFLGLSEAAQAAWLFTLIVILFVLLCLIGIWASGRSAPIFGNADPSQAVIDEVMGQLLVFFFAPFGISWPFILAGFLLFRLFDIWKPYPIRALEVLPGGLGICADDLVAGVYAGVCLAVGHAIYLSI
ncbi:MAG: phosphatidylglycerophosphatase A [Acidobacteriota bacterium]